MLQQLQLVESPMTTDSETETENEEKDPWMPMAEEAMQKHKTAFEEMKVNLIHSGLDEQSAEEKAYSNVLPMLQKDRETIYMEGAPLVDERTREQSCA